MKDTEKKPSMVDRAREAMKEKAKDTIFTDTNKRREKDAGLAKGGMVKKYAKGGMVKRGWGKARCK